MDDIMSDTAKPSSERDFEVKFGPVRLSFAHLHRAQPAKPRDDGTLGPDKFNCSFLIPKDTPEGKAIAKKISDAIKACGDAKWGVNPPKPAAQKWAMKPEKKCLRDGDLETYDGYAGMYYLSASNTRKPALKGRNREDLTEAMGRPYSGCYVNGIVRIWAQDSKEYGRRINASLEGVQFVKDGEAFGAAPLADDAFDNLGDGDSLDDAGAGSEGGGDDDLL